MDKYVIVKNTLKKIKKFNLTGRTLEFKLRPVPNNVEPVTWIKNAINEVVEKSVEDLEPTDKVGFTFCSKEFSRGEGWIPFKDAAEVTFDDVWKIISSIYQSNSTGLATETFCLAVTSIKMPAGKGRAGKYNTFEEECSGRKGIIVINNTDNLCLPRALVVAKTYTDKDNNCQAVRRDAGKIQTARAKELCTAAGVIIPEEGCGIPELEKFQKHLSYKITVYEYGHKGRKVIYSGADDYEKRINLLYHEGHYNVITSLTTAFACAYYCEACHIPFNEKGKHRCGGTCPACQQTPACPVAEKVFCSVCNRQFRGKTCFDKHNMIGSYHKSTVCASIKRCSDCLQTVCENRQHYCGEIFCKICNKHQPSPHNCFIPCDNAIPETKEIIYIFYDLECRQEKLLEDGSLSHEPNLCVFKQCCDECIDTDKEICSKCGVRLQKLYCNDPISPFMHHIMTIKKKFKKVVVIGHNGGGYDHQFLLNYILTETDLTPDIITRGTKLILMSVGNVRFLDSLNYFPMALAKLPTVFGLTELKKGYFPHLFNRLENQNYVGLLPALEYYDPDNMKSDEREKLCKWYEEESIKGYKFDFQKEIVEYCVSDVEILTQACLKFRQLMLNEGNVCPFTEATTLPSACNKIFRRNFLKPETIGIIPRGGYRWRENQSKTAIQWLLWEEKQRNINIIHAAKQGEAVIGGVKVDGYCPETQEIFEFHGCYFHGCPRCFRYNRDKPCHDNPAVTLETRYQDTLAKTARLQTLKYQVITKWQCEFEKETSSEIKRYTEKHPVLQNLPLNPRDAFYGGRTGATKVYYKVSGEEKIKYVDVCSLYPWVNKYGKYPTGHPRVIIGSECTKLNLNEVEGLIKCTMLPPQRLYHPVLPVKLNDKLMFCLCYTCAKQETQEECDHTEAERAITGTWVIDEVRKALELGYRVLNIQEVWEYSVTQYDPVRKTEGLLTGYINKFLKIKQQASGWPRGCETEEEKDQYIKEYLEREGVELQHDEICKNPGLRQLGKAVITSFWGKLGQRENQGKTSIVNDSAQYFNMLTNPDITINTVLPVNEEALIINWEYKDEAYDPLPTVNVVLAAYTTAQARLKLYSYLEKLQEKVLYYDTDSVIYISRPGEYEVPLGNYLGEMTDELECYGAGSYITDFVSGGPKQYAYRVYSPEKGEYYDTIKVKGISVNYNTSKLVNFDKLRNMILYEEPPVYITTKNILRTREHEVVTKEVTKIFRVNFKKRKLIENNDSLPYGYKKAKLL